VRNELSLIEHIKKSKDLKVNLFEKTIKIAILGSFTLNGLKETLKVKTFEIGVNCDVYLAGYNQYNQEILNPESDLYKFKPDITFLIIDSRTILGDLFYYPYSVSEEERKEIIKNSSNELNNLLQKFIEKSNSKLIVTNLFIPIYSPYGISESNEKYGLKEMVYDFNKKLSMNCLDQLSINVYDFNAFIAKYGESNVFNYNKFLLGDIKIDFEFIPHLAHDLMSYVKANLGKIRKCIVLDLDNTLWGGIVGEDGFNGIKLGKTSPDNAYVEFQKHLLSLQQRGIILAINSKNNWDDAIEVINKHPDMVLRERNFASIKINWNDKISNIKEISKELNIGLDSMVFFDDDQANREYMKKLLPEVLTIDLPKDPAQYSLTLMNLNDFSVFNITDEDKNRGEMYLQQKGRIELKNTAEDFEEYLNLLKSKIFMQKANEFNIKRISQLTLKTNQFNLTTKRYQENEIEKIMQEKNTIVGCARIEDKFGDNGITGCYIVKKKNLNEWELDTFLLSCRVMGRKIEDAMMSYIINEVKKHGGSKLIGKFTPTKKNIPAKNFLIEFGFNNENDQLEFKVDKKTNISVQLTIKEED
jgi:FkbH-like protein